MKPLSDYSPNIGGMDIGVSPATPAGERGHRGKGTPCLGAAVWDGPTGDHAGTNQVSGHAEKSRFPARQPAPVRQARARVCAISRLRAW